MSETLFEKIWNSHLVKEKENEASLIYIDRHLIHEVTSPQAFDGLRSNNRKVRRPDLTIATVDHNIPTTDRSLPILDETSSIQIQTLEKNCQDFGIQLFGKNSKNQGIVHVIGPQLGITLPGTTIVCGDSHTSTQGAFGAFAFGIGTSEVEHVLATQALWLEKPKSFEIIATGKRKNSFTITSKDIILSIIRQIGISGGAGHVLEYRGDVISELSMEQRMTICNMSIEAGSRAGLIAPDEYSNGDANQKKGAEKALEYMDLKSGTMIEDIKIDRVFIGSCTNARLEDLIEASKIIQGQKVASSVNAMVVPGSQMVKRQAEEMGLDKIFIDANFEWREAGCSMCLGMNPDILSPGERCASTSNRNFEGRQGNGGRTHLVSPVMAAAAAINGHFVDVRKLDLN